MFKPTILTLILLVSSASALGKFRRLENDGEPTECGAHYYSGDDIRMANSEACHFLEKGPMEDEGNYHYPRIYDGADFDGFSFKGLPPPFYEYPLLAHGKPYEGGNPGPDRIVITQNCLLAGVITHTGTRGDRFLPCTGTS